MTETFIEDIKQMFSKHDKKQHIHLDTVYFINGTDKHNVEIQHMTNQVVMFAKQQSSWGQRRPMQWVPLQLQIANMRMKNINIITKKDLLNVNELNDDHGLEESQLDDFLLVQHSLGLNENELKTEPSDKHLVRLGCQIGIRSFEEFFITLGMEKNDWENIEYMYAAHSPEGIMSMALNKWKVSKHTKLETPSLKDLSDALTAVNLNYHLICQVFREKTQMFEIADFHLQNIPSDYHLKELSNHIGNCPLQLGIELGLSFTDVQQSLVKFPKDLPGLLGNILGKWKKQSNVKTIHSLIMALERVREGGVRYLHYISKLP
ncbi:unnamed protein product [Mytilus edulis]|uniref:Death domain-containing protein n=1 Tax=Mytilus edulis TaxID=6550 RepID=A0A8S3RML7_MYTED|nr:unnamed protein product [Mytilus edulis]